MSWVNKYRPKTVSDYVFANDYIKDMVESFIEEKKYPDFLILYGEAGLGKSALAKLLSDKMVEDLGVQECDIVTINCGADNGIDFIRSNLVQDLRIRPWGKFKLYILEEYSHSTMQAQDAIKAVLDDNPNDAKFIFTANYIQDIRVPIRSRSMEIPFTRLDTKQFRARLEYILAQEQVEYTENILTYWVNERYPDMRATINALENNTIKKKLRAPYNGNENIFEGVEYDPSKVDKHFLYMIANLNADELSKVRADYNGKAQKTITKLNKYLKNGAEDVLITIETQNKKEYLKKMYTIIFLENVMKRNNH